MIMDRQTHARRRTDRHAHRNTPRSHIGGGVTKSHATFSQVEPFFRQRRMYVASRSSNNDNNIETTWVFVEKNV